MKKIHVLLLFVLQCIAWNVSAHTPSGKWITYTPDLTTVLRNPATGWMMYEEGWSFDKQGLYPGNIYTPEVFWKQMEEADASKYANILYIRILWKDLEPEEGKYAWLYDETYKWYIRKAQEHGLKLAFRVFFHGGVPDYVYRAGATAMPVDGEGKIQPHYDNPVFLDKLEKFIAAFAKEYDNPDRVDYVDAYGLGRWGEGHGVTLKDPAKLDYVIKRVTEAYARNFRHVLTVMNLSTNDYAYVKPIVYDRLGFLPRRDGIGSFWFSDRERTWIRQELFPGKAIIGEGCYWFNGYNGDNSHYTAFRDDKRFRMDNFREALTVSVTDALDNHCNTLDLRVPLQCKFWIEELPGEVQRFITLGGYRLYPDYIKVEQDGRRLAVLHAWKNHGVGVMPNNHPNWDYKYQVSFALLDEKGEVKYLFTDGKAEPGEWLKGPAYTYATMLDIPSALKGSYTLCVGITDKTRANAPGIDLAVSKEMKIGKWVKVIPVRF